MKFRALILLSIMLTACSPNEASYTGKFRIDSGTEYVALDKPSSIGGQCSGWKTVAIQAPGKPNTAMQDLLCWRRDGENIIITTAKGDKKDSAPARLWSD